MVPHPLGTRLPSSSGLLCAADRVGKYELRTAGACRPALSVVLGLRCEREVYGTTANQVQVLYSSGTQCGSMTCFCGADLRAWSCTSLFLRKICPILFYLTAFCIIRDLLHICILYFPHFLFVLFIFPLSSSFSSFFFSFPLFPLLLSCFPSSVVPKFGNIWYKNYTE